MIVAIFGVIYLVMGFFTSVLARLAFVIPDLALLEKWVIACAALWPISLPVLLGYFAFVTGPRAVVSRIKKNADPKRTS
jgi:hypothetical protein